MLIFWVLLTFVFLNSLLAADLDEVKQRGVLRHLGIPYANFVTGSGDGLDVELVKLFAQYLGVKYEYIEASWENVIGDLTGKKVKGKGNNIEVIGEAPIKGDLIANGFTIIPWRQKIVNFSTPTFITQVWLVAKADSRLKPIVPQNSIEKDIKTVEALIKGHSLLGKANTCLDPSLYNLKEKGARLKLFPGSLNDLAPAVIKGEAELTLLDVPDALVALEKYPGKIKIIGPITARQYMGCAFPKNSPQLLKAFNEFFQQVNADGTYLQLVKRYYPKVLIYFRDFFIKQ
ncbi:MAG: transporter substrate-binding domain-containing protein [Thermodesulfobacteriota bacterium]